MGYSLCMMIDFQNVLFLEYLVFFGATFYKEQLYMACSLCIMTDFRNSLISRIFGVFWTVFFLHRKTVNDL